MTRCLVMCMLLTGMALGTGCAPAGRVTGPEVWMCHKGSLALADADAEWDFVKRHVTGIKLYIGMINRATDEQLKAFATMCGENGIRVAVECGGTLGFAPLDDTNGEASARIELKAFNRYAAAGGKIDYLDLDGPVRRLLYPPNNRKGFTSVERCADELVDYMRAVRKAHSDIRFNLLTNFPNWGYRGDVSYHARGPKRQDWGDYDTIVRTVLARVEAAGLGFAGVTVDNPYGYAIGTHRSVKLTDPTKIDWMGRIVAYETFARGRRLPFTLIVNHEAGGKQSDDAFCDGTLKMIDAYRAAGGRAERYMIQSWYKHPVVVTPETGHSMTALVKAAIVRLHPSLGQ